METWKKKWKKGKSVLHAYNSKSKLVKIVADAPMKTYDTIGSNVSIYAYHPFIRISHGFNYELTKKRKPYRR